MPHWYHDLIDSLFLPNAELLAYLVAYGELLVGAALVIGLFSRAAALGGVLMNLAFLLAGTTSTNPPLLVLGLVVLAYPRPGEAGLDRWALPFLARRIPGGVKRASRLALLAAGGASLALLAIATAAETPGNLWVAAGISALLAGVWVLSRRAPRGHPRAPGLG